MAPSTSNKMELSISRTPSTQIPTKFEQIHDTSTPKEFLDWARSTSRITDPDVMAQDLYTGSKEYFKVGQSLHNNGQAPVEHKRRFLKWSSHSTSTVSWSLQEEISKPFETALKLIQEELNQNEMALEYGCSDLKQEHGWSYEELGGGCGPPTTLVIVFGLCETKAEWILYVTPLPQLEYN
ncbi:hypothetical protein Tco_1028314 [Tanacetum coccineum]|uniref:Uncharacterized protein n=1 Tax=Tanacetum coccineum TaxID=301880 RepID=A0ABQ5G0B0_9ASTR